MLRFEMSVTLPPAAQALRQEVFMEEQGFSYEFDETDNAALHLVLFDGGEAVACCRMFPDGPDSWHIGRVAVKKDRRGHRLGAAVMEEAEAALSLKGAKKAVLSAQVQAAGFYRKLGYVQVGEEYLDEHCPHVDMEKLLGKAPAGIKE